MEYVLIFFPPVEFHRLEQSIIMRAEAVWLLATARQLSELYVVCHPLAFPLVWQTSVYLGNFCLWKNLLTTRQFKVKTIQDQLYLKLSNLCRIPAFFFFAHLLGLIIEIKAKKKLGSVWKEFSCLPNTTPPPLSSLSHCTHHLSSNTQCSHPQMTLDVTAWCLYAT